jgi:hypothetical protein
MSRIDPDEPQEVSPEAMEVFEAFAREDEENEEEPRNAHEHPRETVELEALREVH